ncbi:MAG: NAD(P)/FAD-dependent oxidoreductase [Bacteroidales bacterium]|nr:NAD(P)/FAD-dependent oxidoreductase [Bacteroidales bacterium]
MNTDILIIGGGAAGLFSAASTILFSKENNLDLPSVTVVEKMKRCGRKIGITGKGRCNLTNTKCWEDFSIHIHPDKNFFRPAFYEMSNVRTMEFFEKIGLPLVKERGDRVFPASYRASDVTSVLLDYVKSNGVKVVTGFETVKIINRLSRQSSVPVETRFTAESLSGSRIEAKYLILATGGLSYPSTGSTGSGYIFAKDLGHKIVNCFPSLTALIPNNYSSCSLGGISLKNVSVSLIVNGNKVREEFGDLDFTTDGIEGPIGFKISREAVYNLKMGQKVSLSLDLKPAVSYDKLKRRIEREVSEKRLPMNKLLLSYLPKALIDPFMKLQRPLNYNNLPDKLKEWRFVIDSCVGYRRAVVTAGGVDLKEVNTKTMQSKIVEGLYFAGELLNLDADTGGYNLQIAFSTGALAAKSIVREIATN